MMKNVNKTIMFLLVFLVFLIASCKPSEQEKEHFCGDNICESNEEENVCAVDCGRFEDITKLECANAKGSWNDCGSPCAGTDAEFCIQVCSPQCECGGIAGFTCPSGYKCRLTGKTVDELGVCVKE